MMIIMVKYLLYVAAFGTDLSFCNAFQTTKVWLSPHNRAMNLSFHNNPTLTDQQMSRFQNYKDNIKKDGLILSSSSSSSNSDSDSVPPFKEEDTNPIKIFSLLMIGLPFISILFPQIEQFARSFPPNSSEQFEIVLALFVSNRIYLYALSATIVALASLRGATDNPQLGQRITDLTEELLYRPTLSDQCVAGTVGEGKEENIEKSLMIQSIKDSGLSESLDQVSTETQAFFLPVLVSALLAVSVFLLPFWNEPTNILSGDTGRFAQVQELLSQILPQINQAWNIGLLTVFTRQEVRRLGFETSLEVLDSPIIEWTISIGIICMAFFVQLWPAQNFVNMALAILVARAVQLETFPAIVGALSLLTLYDASSVLLIPAAANAMEYITTATGDSVVLLTDASSPTGSAMGSVAMQKLMSGTFQPSLLITKIGGRLGGGLGLGDAVFPSILVNFVRRFDFVQENDSATEKRIPLFAVSMIAYLLGCFACEFAPIISSSGLPALVFIIPTMIGSVILVSLVSREFTDLWKFNSKSVLNISDSNAEY